ncbi:MAG: hypothetical protein AAB289_02630 [Chloroflexota bacterium]
MPVTHLKVINKAGRVVWRSINLKGGYPVEKINIDGMMIQATDRIGRVMGAYAIQPGDRIENDFGRRTT